MRISTILDKIDERQLFVPAFQREYVWKRADAKELLDSLIKEYPTGTMLTWETNQPPELKGPHQYSPQQGAVRILLDGQQRVTTLYLLIRGKTPPYYTDAEILNPIQGLYVNLETGELQYFSKQKMEKNPCWQDITSVFQKKIRRRDVIDRLEKSGEAVDRNREDRIEDVMLAVERILDREFPEQTIPIKANVREAIDIFYKVNAGGVSLTDAELALAQISGYWPQARDLFKAKLAELADAGFVFKLDFIVYALLGCVHHLGSDMRKLHGPENDSAIRAAWAKLDGQVLDYVVSLLRSSAFVDHSSEINSVYALIPIIAYIHDKGGVHLSQAEIGKMVKWFYYSQLRTRYANSLPQKLDKDLRIVAESESPFDDMLRVIEEDRPLLIVPSEFEGRAVGHPLFGLMRWYFKSHNAVCLTTGVAIRQAMGRKYKLENDHIFPYSRLKAVGYADTQTKYALAQELTNRAILTQLANRTKSDRDADEYLDSVKARNPASLALQCIPEDPELWKIENYEAFLVARRTMLAGELNSFLQGIARTEETMNAVSVEDLIAEGESDSLEFKETLRWDVVEQKFSKGLEDVIVKAIAAFANAAGGTLLVGVADEGVAVGLERDYASLGDADRDKFERHFLNLLGSAYGHAFVASKIKVAFPMIGDAEICHVTIAPASQALITKVTDKNGQQSEKMFVRSGNSSREMPISEMQQYIRDRFR